MNTNGLDVSKYHFIPAIEDVTHKIKTTDRMMRIWTYCVIYHEFRVINISRVNTGNLQINWIPQFLATFHMVKKMKIYVEYMICK